jgi:hypothetical protein
VVAVSLHFRQAKINSHSENVTLLYKMYRIEYVCGHE